MAALSAALEDDHRAAPRYQLRLPIMGTQAHLIAVQGDPELLDEARERLVELHNKWTRFETDSEVSRINAAAGSAVEVSPETVLLVGLAVTAWAWTEGRYDPSGNSGCDGVKVDTENMRITVAAGTSLDFGGIAKGLAADLVVADLLDGGAIGACVNIGGDLRVSGVAPRRGGWIVGVDHPRQHFLASCLRVQDGAVATSSRMKRTWGPASGHLHQLIDPATGMPARTPVQSVTVVTDEGWYAEALAKAAFLAGPDEGARVLEAAGASDFFFCDDDRTVAVGDWHRLSA